MANSGSNHIWTGDCGDWLMETMKNLDQMHLFDDSPMITDEHDKQSNINPNGSLEKRDDDGDPNPNRLHSNENQDVASVPSKHDTKNSSSISIAGVRGRIRLVPIERLLKATQKTRPKRLNGRLRPHFGKKIN